MFKIVPDIILEKIQKQSFIGKDEFFVFFVDIKGFTRLTENLMRNDVKGSETLSDIINFFFGELIKIVYKFGGDVLTFAGDAFTAILEKEKKENLLLIIDSILTFSRDNGKIQTSNGDFILSVKIGVSFGDVEWSILGEDKKIYFFKGDPINVAANMEKLCGENESFFSNEAKNFFDQNLFVYFQNGYKYLNRENNLNSNIDFEIKIFKEDEVKKFSNVELPSEFMGEFRDVGSLFVSFDKLEEKDYEEFFLTLFELTQQYKGYFNLIDFGDKGGKVFIIFGAPKSFENDLLRGINLFYDKKLDPYRSRIRCGLTYGKVYAGYVGSTIRSTYTVLGDRVNVSARIMVESDHGELCIDEFTEKLIGTKFKTIFKTEKFLKGKSEKEKIFKVLNDRIFEEKIYFENEIVGRENEIKVIENTLKKISDGRNGGAIYIFGDAGVGKSRIMFEIISRNKDLFQFLIFKNEDVDNEEFSSIKKFLFDFFKQDRFVSKEENLRNFDMIFEDFRKKDFNEMLKENSKEIFKFLLNIADTDSPIYRFNKKQIEESIFFSLKEFIIFLSNVKPVVILVDDLQFQDKRSDQFFEILSREVLNYPFTIIISSRYLSDGSKKLLNFDQQFSVEIIELKSFDYNSCKNYIENQLIFSPSEETIKFIFERTEGNPFFVEQFSIYLLENDYIKNENGKNVLTGEVKNIPSTISSIIIARIDRLNEELKSLIEKSSVIGYEIEREILKRVSRLKNFDERVKEIERENILLKLNELKLIFKHSLIRDTVYNMILKKKLKEYHSMVAEIMEKLFYEDEERLSDIAFHYERGENYEKAKEFYIKSGDYAHKKFRLFDSLKFYEKSLNYAYESSDRIFIRSKLYRIKFILGIWQEVKNDYEQLLNEIVEYADDKLKSEILKDYGDLLFQMGFYDECQEYLDKSYEVFARLNNKKELADILSIKAQIFWRKNEFKKAIEYCEKTKEFVEQEDDPETYANIFLTKGNIAKDMGDYDEAIKNYEQVIRIAQDNNILLTLSSVYGNLGLIYWMKGEFDNALSKYLEAEKILKNVNSKSSLSYLYGNLGALYYSMKEYQKAEDFFMKQLKISRELNDRKSIRIVLNNLGGIANIKGDYSSESEFYKESLQLAEQLNDRLGKRTVLSNLGQLYALLGDFDVAQSYLKESLKISEEINEKKGIALNHFYLSHSYLLQNLLDESLKHIEKSIEILNEIKLTQYYYIALLLKAEILIKKNMIEDGIKLINEGIEFFKDRKEYSENFVKGTLLKLIYVCKDENEFISECNKLLLQYDEENIKGEIYYALFKKTGKKDFRVKAFDIYEKLYEKFKNYLNFLRLEELKET
ncbi:MAG: tetratricopeptide repeat protein [candidate division WOR-3 bacterium]